MSNKKAKSPPNNENVCPLTGKRLADNPADGSTRKILKLETTSSPSALSTDNLQDMGIGMLDSEESSSSVASAMVLTLNASTSGSADENSNEGMPKLDAPKYCHKLIMYRPTGTDTGLDDSVDNANTSNSQQDMNKTLKAALSPVSISHNAANKYTVFDITYNSSQQQSQIAQHKKVSMLVGSVVTNTPSGNALQSGAIASSASCTRGTRSPLAMVACNSRNRNTASIVHPLHHPQTPASQHASDVSGSTGPQNTIAVSPSIPSTSRQAAAAMQQRQRSTEHQIQKQYEQKRQLQLSASRLSPTDGSHCGRGAVDGFFLFRNRNTTNGRDYINELSDEIILQIFKWLPKKTLLHCSYVCRRFSRCASDDSLWTRLDIGGRVVRAGAMGNILTRGVVILRVAQAELLHPIFEPNFFQNEAQFVSKLQYLDLSMATVTKLSLKMMLTRCRHLRKLSLEHVPINDGICGEIAKNSNLEALNLAMCSGLEAWSVRKLMESLNNLNSLNISWTNLSVEAVTSMVTNVTPNMMRLNVAGCRKTMFDSHLASLVKHCPNLLELDLSDCTGLTGGAISIICKFKMLEYLSLSRCYLIPPPTYMDLINMPTLHFLDVFGMLSDSALDVLEHSFHSLGINKFIHSSVARPTVGTRRTSIWGLRTRD